jgi:hypothetical protein
MGNPPTISDTTPSKDVNSTSLLCRILRNNPLIPLVLCPFDSTLSKTSSNFARSRCADCRSVFAPIIRGDHAAFCASVTPAVRYPTAGTNKRHGIDPHVVSPLNWENWTIDEAHLVMRRRTGSENAFARGVGRRGR